MKWGLKQTDKRKSIICLWILSYFFPHVVRICPPRVVRIHLEEINLILPSKWTARGKRLRPSGADCDGRNDNNCPDTRQMGRGKQCKADKWADYMVSNNYFISCARCYPLPNKDWSCFCSLRRHLPPSNKPSTSNICSQHTRHKFSAYFESRVNQALLKFF